MPRAVSAAGAGERDLPITIQQLVEGAAESSFPTEDWTPLAKAFARREYQTLDERVTGDQVSATAIQRWEIPYTELMDPDRVDVAKKRRITYLSRTYDIQAAEILPRASGRSIIITTLAKVG